MDEQIIEVHLDDLEYTREGFKTHDSRPIPLKVGYRNVLRFIRPPRVRVADPGVGGFAFNSAFPTSGVLQLLLVPAFDDILRRSGQTGPKPIFQVFGHADTTGDDGANKTLSERRARVVLALLKGDTADFGRIADEDGWSEREHQLMLRVLQCDPGPPDGKPGPLTEQATKAFQAQYNAKVFHRHTDEAPSQSLEPTGALDSATKAAIIEAFVYACSPRLAQDQLHPTHPAVGCSEYNLFSETAPFQNRRVSLAIHRSLPKHHERAPCKAGDHASCPADENGPTRCLWYREHFVDPHEDDVIHRHFDLRWLPTAEGNVILSALSTLPDGEHVTFRVHRSIPLHDFSALSEAALAEAMSDELEGEVSGGVAWAVWEAKQHLEWAFDFSNWVRPLTATDIRSHSPPSLTVPLFTIKHQDTTVCSAPPSRDASRYVYKVEDTEELESHLVRAITIDGRLAQFPVNEGAVDTEQPAISGFAAVAEVLQTWHSPVPDESSPPPRK